MKEPTEHDLQKLHAALPETLRRKLSAMSPQTRRDLLLKLYEEHQRRT